MTGAAPNDPMVNDPTYNAFDTQALSASTTSDVQTIVQAANQYVAQQHFVISLLQPYQYALYQPWLNVTTINLVVTGSRCLFNARFWIDQSLER